MCHYRYSIKHQNTGEKRVWVDVGTGHDEETADTDKHYLATRASQWNHILYSRLEKHIQSVTKTQRGKTKECSSKCISEASDSAHTSYELTEAKCGGDSQ